MLGEWLEAVDGLGSRGGAGQRAAVDGVLFQRSGTVVWRAVDASSVATGS